jgi:hypothetical protein
MSSFDGEDLFGSGPHRFQTGASGVQLELNARGAPGLPGSRAIGPLETTVTVRGRLVAASDSGLRAQLSAINAKLTMPPVRGTLVDEQGGVTTGVDFVNFAPGDRVDRGRVVSLAYEARFVALIG